MGLFPRVVYADGDGRKDLLIGEAEGRIILFTNINTDEQPEFGVGSPLQTGESGQKTEIDIGQRPTPIVIDWNGDGIRDILAGAKDGKLYLFINEGTDTAWDFLSSTAVQENGFDMIVPSLRASPQMADLDGDGDRDLVTGNTEGQILFYGNIGSDSAPLFSGYVPVESDGAAIDLEGLPRSRPFICDWNEDGAEDILVGAGDGRIHLFLGESTTIASDDSDPAVPASVRLLAAYPNPFNPVVRVPFELTRNTTLTLRVYDSTGRLVRELENGHFEAGPHESIWTGTGYDGRQMGSGVYFLRLSAEGAESMTKVILLR